MNLTLKSKSWVGNIYHQFESICQDVDDFMTKDTVRFVENQVQSVGTSVKRLYSNVVQDIPPPSQDIADPGSQPMEGEQVTTTNGTQLSENQGSFDNFRNSDVPLPIEVESAVHENSSRVPSPLAAISVFDGEIFSGTSDEDHKNSVHEEGLIAVTTEIRDFSDTGCLIKFSSRDAGFESKLTMVENPSSDGTGSLSDPMVASTMDSSDSSACAVSSKDESFDVLSSIQSLERVCSGISCDEEDVKETDKRSLSCSTSPKSSNILDFANFIEKAEKVCQFHAESNGADYETKAVDELPAYSIFVSNDDAFTMDGSDFVGGMSESEMSRQSDTGNIDECGVGIGDLDIGTVVLSSDVKRDETSAILNRNALRAVSHGKRNLRYYKKLVRDALTSRKRLSKEYEHLAIIYGDIDFESSQHFESNSLLSSPNTSLHAERRTQSFHETSETEWELV